MKKKIMVDMDGVICNDNFMEYVEHFLNKKFDIERERIYFRQQLISGKESEFKSIYENENLYEGIEIYPKCYEVLERLSQKYEIYIVTAYIWQKNIINPSQNLKNKFSFLSEKLPFLNPKNFIFINDKRLLDFDFRIDDRVSGFKENSVNILFSNFCNKNIENDDMRKYKINRVNNWEDIEKFFSDYENVDFVDREGNISSVTKSDCNPSYEGECYNRTRLIKTLKKVNELLG